MSGRHVDVGASIPTRAALFHGFTGSANAWGTTVLNGLAEAGVEPIALDLPGHGENAGRSDPVDFTLDGALGRIAVGVAGARVVVGYSMGGRLALHHALRPNGDVRRLVLESASPGLAGGDERESRRQRDAALAGRIVELGIEAFVREWEALPLFSSQRRLPTDVRSAHRSRRLSNDPASLAAALRGLGAGTLPSLWDRLGELRVPVLLLAGELDEKFVEIGARMERALPDARLEVVAGAGHAVHLERPEAWLDLVVPFARD